MKDLRVSSSEAHAFGAAFHDACRRDGSAEMHILCKSQDILDRMRTCRGVRAHFDDWPMTDAHRGRHALQNCACVRILDIPERLMAKNICAPVDPARAAVSIHLGGPQCLVLTAAPRSNMSESSTAHASVLMTLTHPPCIGPFCDRSKSKKDQANARFKSAQ